MSLTHIAKARSFQERGVATPGPDGDESDCSVVANVPRAPVPPRVSQTVPDPTVHPVVSSVMLSARQTCATDWPLLKATSASQSLVRICSTVCLMRGIQPSFRLDPNIQDGPV